MFHVFNGCLDGRLDQLNVTPEIRQSLNEQRINLAATEVPASAGEATRMAIKQAIDDCFVSGFRRVMLTGAVLAFASSLIAWLLIRTH
jgi:hypothetical protein